MCRQFLNTQFNLAKSVGASTVYVVMFGEVDEGIVIFKCSNDVPNGEQSQFVTYEGLPRHFYLKLVGAGTKLIYGQTESLQTRSLR